MEKRLRLGKVFNLVLILGVLVCLEVSAALSQSVLGTGDFVLEGASSKYSKTWIATITCRRDDGSEETFGKDASGKGWPFTLQTLVAKTIEDHSLPYTKPTRPLVRSDGGWNDNSKLHMPTLMAVCKILGYSTFVSSTCRDSERSSTYPSGKCNFHTPHNDKLTRFKPPKASFPERMN